MARILGVNIDSSAVLPVAVGVAGVVYYAMEARAPHGAGASAKQTRDWEKHTQTGQLIAVAALSAGALLLRFKAKKIRGGNGDK